MLVMSKLPIEGFSSDRIFRLWDLRVSHSQLLIRSPKEDSDVGSKNLDLIFTGVFYLDLVELFRGLEVDKPTEEELSRLQARSGSKKDAGHRFYVLSSSRNRLYVGAASLHIEHNDLPPMKSSLGIL